MPHCLAEPVTKFDVWRSRVTPGMFFPSGKLGQHATKFTGTAAGPQQLIHGRLTVGVKRQRANSYCKEGNSHLANLGAAAVQHNARAHTLRTPKHEGHSKSRSAGMVADGAHHAVNASVNIAA